MSVDLEEPRIDPPLEGEEDEVEIPDREVWYPEPEPFVDYYEEEEIARKRRDTRTRSNILPSTFAEFAFRMPRDDGQGYAPFTFKGRRHMLRPYDSPSRRILLVCARQVEKSTLLGNAALTYSCLVPGHRTLYVSPSATQTKTFSADRIKEPLDTSDILGAFTTRNLSQNILEKQFVNRSKITLRYAFLNADRCAVGSTRVHFTTGDTATLQEIWERPANFVGRQVWSANPHTRRVVPRTLTEVVEQGVRPVFRVRLANTAEVVVTDNQPLLTPQGWKEVKDVPVGTLIATPGQVPHGVGNDLPPEMYRLVGYLLGDGTSTTCNSTAFFNGNPRVMAEFQRCALALGGVLGKLQDSNRKRWVHAETKRQGVFGGWKGLKSQLRELGLYGRRHNTKRVPTAFFTGNKEQLSAFFGAIWATDGWAYAGKGQYEIGYASNSQGLLRDMQVLLLRFGISAYVSKQKKPSTPRALGAYCLSIRSKVSVERFLENIPVLGKEEELEKVRKAASRVSRCKDDEDRIDYSYAQLREYLKTVYNLSTHSAWKKHRIQLRPGNQKDSIGRRVLAAIADKLDDALLRYLANSDLSWSRLAEVVPEGEQPTYDLSVQGLENYLVDGVFIHNTRGIPAWRLLLDEIQDILFDNIPIIEQCTSHAPEMWKRFIYAGTPKSLDNGIEYYRSQHSTQGEWVVPCDAHGGETGRYWNILGEKNIGKKGLICESCGKPLNPVHPDAQWANQVEKAAFESYRIPQLMVPWKDWSEILLDYARYPRDKFYNEVLGISYDSGTRPLTKLQLMSSSNSSVRMHPKELRKYRDLAHGQPVFAGIDWGTGENSFTVLSLGTYINGKFRVFYIHRFEGELTDLELQMEKITEILVYFSVDLIGTDYGGGFDRNDKLVRRFGPQRVQKFQYMARARKKVEYDAGLQRWKVFRTAVMSDMFNAIKRAQFEFPRWEEFAEPFAQDMLNIFSEYNNSLRMTQYTHHPDRPDDTFHSLVYLFLASMIRTPRPDIIAPRKEFPNQGGAVRGGGYDDSLSQG